jgi:hypothetical protein
MLVSPGLVAAQGGGGMGVVMSCFLLTGDGCFATL